MKLVQKVIKKFKKKEKKETNVVTTRDLTKHMQETRTMLVPKYNEKNEELSYKNTSYK